MYCARRGASGALYPKPTICGAELLHAVSLLGYNMFSIDMLISRSYAISCYEPCQVRNEAALSRCRYVP